MHQVQPCELVGMIQADELKRSAAVRLEFCAEIRRRRMRLHDRAGDDPQCSGSTKLLEGSQFVIAFPVDRVY